MERRYLVLFICFAFCFILAADSFAEQEKLIKRYPLSNREGLIAQSEVVIDKQVSSDGNGSLKISLSRTSDVVLYTFGPVNLDRPRLIYKAQLRTQDAQGQVYLQLRCSVVGKGDFFSNPPAVPLTGSKDWTTQEVEIDLQKGESVDSIELRLISTGAGTIWIDDAQILEAAAKKNK